METIGNKNIFYGFLLFASTTSVSVWAQNIEEIQRQFNQETMSKPFIVPDDASLTASLKAATDRGTPPKSPAYVTPSMPLLGGFGYGGYMRPYYGGLYGGGYHPFYGGWW
jgi:hypothetical protein